MDRGGKGYVTKEDYVHLAKTQPELIKQVGLGGTGARRRSRKSSFIDHPPAPAAWSPSHHPSFGRPPARPAAPPRGAPGGFWAACTREGRRWATGRAATAAGARASRLHSRRCRRLSLSPQADGKKGRKRVSGPRKRGTTVTFGSAKWELVVQMMLGIRRAAEPEPEP